MPNAPILIIKPIAEKKKINNTIQIIVNVSINKPEAVYRIFLPNRSIKNPPTTVAPNMNIFDINELYLGSNVVPAFSNSSF